VAKEIDNAWKQDDRNPEKSSIVIVLKIEEWRFRKPTYPQAKWFFSCFFLV
jgi:hypothetical protein